MFDCENAKILTGMTLVLLMFTPVGWLGLPYVLAKIGDVGRLSGRGMKMALCKQFFLIDAAPYSADGFDQFDILFEQVIDQRAERHAASLSAGLQVSQNVWFEMNWWN